MKITEIFNKKILDLPYTFIKLEDTHDYVGIGFNFSLTTHKKKYNITLDPITFGIQVVNYLFTLGIIFTRDRGVTDHAKRLGRE